MRAVVVFSVLAFCAPAVVGNSDDLPRPIPSHFSYASWYGHPYHGRRTANGEVYDMHTLTAAHRVLPFGTLLRVTNLENGFSVKVRINDRGPFVAERELDLSLRAARAIGLVEPGSVRVRYERIPEDTGFSDDPTAAAGMMLGD